MRKSKEKIFIFILVFVVSMTVMQGMRAQEAPEPLLPEANMKQEEIIDESVNQGSDQEVANENSKTDTGKELQDPIFFELKGNQFIPKAVGKKLFTIQDEQNATIIGENINGNKLIKVEISQTADLYDEITLEEETLSQNELENMNYALSLKDPCNAIEPLIFKEKKDSPFVNRLKTVYFLTSLSTGIGQSGQIQEAFTKGESLTGGGTSKGEYYGYANVVRNLANPFGRAIKGARVDDSGTVPNFTLHPLFGFGISSYMVTAGASNKEALLVTLADNFIFEYIVEGTYVAPSGLDLLTTSGGCFAGFLVSKYILHKPFKAILKVPAALKEKYNIEFDPIIEPGYIGRGMKIGSQVTIKH
jgi:hypothetical protein